MITFLIVLYTSRVVDSLGWKWGTDLYAAAWAFIILVIANIATGGDYGDWRVYGLAFFNSFLVAASAGKLRDKSIKEKEKKEERKREGQTEQPVVNNENVSDLSQ